jgi:hypothetical protein
MQTTQNTTPNAAQAERDVVECVALLREAHARVERLAQLPPEALESVWPDGDGYSRQAPAWLLEDVRALAYNMSRALDAFDGVLPPELLSEARRLEVSLDGADVPAVVHDATEEG